MGEISKNIVVILLVSLVILTVISALTLLVNFGVFPTIVEKSSTQGTVSVYVLPQPSSSEGHVSVVVLPR